MEKDPENKEAKAEKEKNDEAIAKTEKVLAEDPQKEWDETRAANIEAAKKELSALTKVQGEDNEAKDKIIRAIDLKVGKVEAPSKDAVAAEEVKKDN